MGPFLVGAAGLMWGHVVVAGPGPGGGLGALRLPPWGLRSAAGSCGALRLLPAGTLGSCGSCGALRLLPAGTLGSCGSCGAVAPAALGDFGVDWGCLHNSRYYVAEF